jgi:hypothetical protein
MFAGTAQTTTIRPNQNRIKVMATLQGVAINSAMQQQVERVFENLHSVLDNTFN